MNPTTSSNVSAKRRGYKRESQPENGGQPSKGPHQFLIYLFNLVSGLRIDFELSRRIGP